MDKGRTLVITDRDTCQQNVKTVVQENHFTKIYEDPTDVNPKQLRQQYTTYPDMRYITCFNWTRSHWILNVKDVCIHNPETFSNWERITEESHYCMVLLLQQYGLYWLKFVI